MAQTVAATADGRRPGLARSAIARATEPVRRVGRQASRSVRAAAMSTQTAVRTLARDVRGALRRRAELRTVA